MYAHFNSLFVVCLFVVVVVYYQSFSMCILASREHTCIHPDVSKSKNKNDECKKLLEYDSVSQIM